MRVWRILSRVATVAGIVGGLLFLLLVTASLIAFVPGGARGRGSQSIDHEPISRERALELIDVGQIYMVAIRKEGNMDEYVLLEEGLGGRDPYAEPERRWKVEGVDVHVFTETMPTGVPLSSGDEDRVGITPDQLSELLQPVDQFNAASSWQIKVLDQRE